MNKNKLADKIARQLTGTFEKYDVVRARRIDRRYTQCTTKCRLTVAAAKEDGQLALCGKHMELGWYANEDLELIRVGG